MIIQIFIKVFKNILLILIGKIINFKYCTDKVILMKKGFLLYVIFFAIIFFATMFFIVTYSSALIYPTQCPNATEGVCGQCPDSLTGYGQISFLGVPSSCNNFADSICPEDFQNGSNDNMTGNCYNCHDPDCTGTVNGTVFANGLLLGRVTVKALPIRYNLSAPSMERSTITSTNGQFSLSGITTGTYYLSAIQDGFDTQLLLVTVKRNQTTTGVVFNLENGTCYEDCTNSYGRCNAQCDGLNFSAGGFCGFYNTTVATLCDNRFKGTDVMIPGSDNGTHAQFINCCEGTPYVKYYSQAVVSTSSIKNLAKIEKIVKYNDQPVRVVIAYWSNLE